LVAGGLGDDFAAGVGDVGAAVEGADVPGFVADPIEGGDVIAVGDGVGGLFQLPQVFGEPGDSGGGVEDDFRAVLEYGWSASSKV